MDIKIIVGDKEVIAPVFDFRLNETSDSKNILILCIHGFNKKEQTYFLDAVKNLEEKNLFINSQYVAVVVAEQVYLFNLSVYKDHKFENMIISGYYDFMFAFVDENDKIIDMPYAAMSLNGHPIKELQ